VSPVPLGENVGCLVVEETVVELRQQTARLVVEATVARAGRVAPFDGVTGLKMESTLTSGPVNTLGSEFQGGVILTGMVSICRPRGLSWDLERYLDGHLSETIEPDRTRATLGRAWCMNQ
jgi:hypothetical protein